MRRAGSEVDPGTLRKHLTDKVPRWWLPSHWTFIEEVPLTGTGKYDKKVLRQRYADGELAVTHAD